MDFYTLAENQLKQIVMDVVKYVVVLVVVILVFILLRELWCWYWKLNKIVENQEKQTKTLMAIGTVLERIEKQGMDNTDKPESE